MILGLYRKLVSSRGASLMSILGRCIVGELDRGVVELGVGFDLGASFDFDIGCWRPGWCW